MSSDDGPGDDQRPAPAPRPDPDDVVGAGKSLQDNAVFTMFTGAAAAFGGGTLAGQHGPRLSSKVQALPWWVQLAFGIVLWQPILTVPLFYLVTRSWAQAAIIAACPVGVLHPGRQPAHLDLRDPAC